MKIWLRELTEADLPFLLGIRNECRDMLHNNAEFNLEGATKWFQAAGPRFYVIIADGVDVGYFRTSNWEADSLWIGADIHKDFRGRGIAKAAYPVFMSAMNRDHGIRTFILEVLAHNTRAHSLYLKLGFQEVERTMCERGESIKMEKTWHV